ncbi:putative baseplate assembly protein [Desulfogranum japonicum]|uniref:putative baseplate assembly protein n=1 Tax=Desulfogranum japonicum TaxID=231447 RepID=UPI00041D3398|nr:putative baseplate assembly protein [Desulfogranum japonicum]
MSATYFCCDEGRRQAVRETMGPDNKPVLNGIDYLEVAETDQRILLVHCIHPLPGQTNGVPQSGALTADNILVTGGMRVTDILVEEVAATGTVLQVQVDQPGDFSLYQLVLVAAATQPAEPPEGFDPRLATIEFSFKVHCPSVFDCCGQSLCPTEKALEPAINYLAKDYGGFRQLMLDRLAVLSPEWKERHSADLGITLVELLAHVGDQLSYQQDAVATEAYLDTARRRVSIKRHARLVDYFMHEGCNARVWVQVLIAADGLNLPEKTQFFTRCAGMGAGIQPGSDEYRKAINGPVQIFEAMHASALFKGHNCISLYTWSDDRCCLPKGATSATLDGHFPDLLVSDVLILLEMYDPRTGVAADADPARRHPVRLTQVSALTPAGTQRTDPLTGAQITEITWHQDDALPFPICISSEIEQDDNTMQVIPVGFALGNIILADHGRTCAVEPLGIVPKDEEGFTPIDELSDWCSEITHQFKPARFRPQLQHLPLTHQAVRGVTALSATGITGKPLYYDPQGGACDVFNGTPEAALPAVVLTDCDMYTWLPQRDLLASSPFDRDFVVETENDGSVFLRFGDDEHGMRPNAGVEFQATYRVGNGTSGNIGAGTLAHIVTDTNVVRRVWNPLPASGGIEPESMEEVRRFAPIAFRQQERAVTTEDYEAMARNFSGVQNAAANLRWTGSWYTVFLVIDRLGGLPVDTDFSDALRAYMEKYRMAGHDIEVMGPQLVPLEITMRICVQREYFRSAVYQSLLHIFHNTTLGDGRKGMFHPDSFTFGQPVYGSVLIAAAQDVAGVAEVELTTFQRLDKPGTDARARGILPMGHVEIALLDNDPNFPERGRFHMDVQGGK